MKINILKSSFTLVIISAIGKLLGLIRESLVAGRYGAGLETDALFLAQGAISNIFYAISTAIAVAFLPVYLERLAKRGRESTARFAFSTLCTLMGAAVLLIILLIVLAPWIAPLIAPLYQGELLQKVINYLRIFSLGIVFSLAANLLANLLNAERIYGYAAVTGILYSATLILFILGLHSRLGIYAIVLAIPTAYFIQFIVLGLRSRKYLTPHLGSIIGDPDFKALLLAATPILLSNTLVELNQLVMRTLASSTGVGGVSALSYAGVLSQVVTSLIIASFITVCFTEFSNSAAAQNAEELGGMFRQGVTMMAFVLIPITMITWVMAPDVVRIIYGRGQFDEAAVRTTATALRGFGLIFLPLGVYNLATRALYALRAHKTAMYVSMATMAISILASILFARAFGFAGILAGGAVAFFCAMCMQTGALKKKLGALRFRGNIPSLIKMLLAGLLAGGCIGYAQGYMQGMGSLARFCVATVLAGIVYITALWLFRCKELLAALTKARALVKGRHTT